MTITRIPTNRGGASWALELSSQDAIKKRRMVMHFNNIGAFNPTMFEVSVEIEVAEYAYIVKNLAERPKGSPIFRKHWREVERSMAPVQVATGAESILVRALGKNQIIGEAAESAVHTLFWMHFVERDVGLEYLYRHAEKDAANFYGRQRLRAFIDHDVHWKGRASEIDSAVHAIEDAFDRKSTLADRFARQLVIDRNLTTAQAIIALTDLGESDDAKHTRVREFVELHATQTDQLIARLYDAFDSDCLAGLRACQQVEAGNRDLINWLAPALNEHRIDTRDKVMRLHLKEWHRKQSKKNKGKIVKLDGDLS